MAPSTRSLSVISGVAWATTAKATWMRPWQKEQIRQGTRPYPFH